MAWVPSTVETPPSGQDVEAVTLWEPIFGSAQHSQPASLIGQIVLNISLTETEGRRRRQFTFQIYNEFSDSS